MDPMTMCDMKGVAVIHLENYYVTQFPSAPEDLSISSLIILVLLPVYCFWFTAGSYLQHKSSKNSVRYLLGTK